MPSTTQLLMYLLIHAFLVAARLAYSHGTYSNQTAISVRCLPEQASALLLLKRSFSTNGWGPFDKGDTCTLASWRAGTDCCGWSGIRCGHADGRVTTLDLGNCGLESGGLHPSLFDLTSLRHLNLSWNSFNGSELPTIGFERLTQLIHLDLSNCQFAGHIPDAIGRLNKLVSLDLSKTDYVIDMDDVTLTLATWSPEYILEVPNIESLVANLSNLEELYLSQVDLSDNGAAWCNAFANYSTPQLQVLSLPNTNLLGPICESLSSIHSLTEVNLQYNQLPGQIPESFADLRSLSVLMLAKNSLGGWFPKRIFQNNNLTVVDIRYNFEISGSLPNFSSHSILTDLLVSNTNFSGPVPSSIRNLKSLNNLGLAVVGSSQQLPSSIGELTSLRMLELSGTGLIGAIPSWILYLTSLKILELTDCGLSGQIPSSIGNLKNLTRLQLSSCNFSGQIPPHLFNLTQLKVINLDSNNFIGTIELSSFFMLPELFSLDLSNNMLSVVDGEDNSSWTSVKFMDTLRLASCQISKFPVALRHMGWIQFLDLSENHIRGTIPQWAWQNWNYLRILKLSQNQFSSIQYAPPVFPGDISIIDLSFNLFEGTLPIPGPSTQLLDCTNNKFSSMPLNFGYQLNTLSYFMASRNNLSGNIPPSICDATSLVLLELSYNNLSGSIPSCLMEEINSLTVLNLKRNRLRSFEKKRNRLHGELPHDMKQGCALEALDLSDNWLEGSLPKSLIACRELEVFDIGHNRIKDTFPCWMSMLPKLQVLVLKSNEFIGKIGPSALGDKSSCEFMGLRIFDVASNSFSGPLPNEWFKTMKSMITKSNNETLVMETRRSSLLGYSYQFTATFTLKGQDIVFSKILKTLVVIDASDNAFAGVIPKSIGDLALLSAVNMSHNALSGQIPFQFGTLHQLESLDLSSNDLSGDIPQTLASLNFLSMLNLSYNELVGRIPESPQFLTFSNLSFLGNIGLCGLQVSRACNNVTPNAEPHHSEKKSVDIILFLVTGLGFGAGFAIAIVITWGIPVKRTQGRTFMWLRKVFFFV